MIMHKLFLSVLLVICCVSLVPAQSNKSSRAEFFAGYSVLRTKYEIEQTDSFDPVIVFFDGKQTAKGFNVSGTGYLSKGFGITGDFSGHFKTNRPGNIETKIRVFNVLGGPQYKFRNNSPVSPYVRALAGVAHTRARLAYLNVTDTASSTDFALAIGGGLDVRISDRIDLRVFQADYNPIFLRRGNEFGFGRTRADNVRFSFGVVFK
jgi:opacity protein-like surface antigen